MQKFTCSPVHMCDLPRVMQIISAAREYMVSLGNPQWQNGFPDSAYLTDKTERGLMYAVRACGGIVGVFSVVPHEPDYDEICGKWLFDGQYLAVHTVAVAPEARGAGCARFIFKNAFEMALQSGAGSVRVDTHQKNVPMRGLLASLGFTCCGTVTLSDGSQRLAFEKII